MSSLENSPGSSNPLPASNSGNAVKVAILCAVSFVCEALGALLSGTDGFDAVGLAQDIDDALGKIAPMGSGVLLLDPGLPHALAALGRIRSEAPAWKILGLGLSRTMPDEIAWVAAGANGCILPLESREDALEKFRVAARSEAPPVEGIASEGCISDFRDGAPPNELAVLTTRESEVLRLMDQGLSNQEIADQLSIEVTTVKNHVHSILTKLNLDRRAQVPAWIKRAERRGPILSRVGDGSAHRKS